MSATITAALSHGITLNTGTYGEALSITSTGGISAAAGAAGAYLAAGEPGEIGIFTTSPASITNAGFILGGAGGVGGLYAPTLMSNTYFIGVGGPGAAGGMALYSAAALILTNSGTIAGGAGGAGAADGRPGNGGTGAAAITGGAGSTVINTGLIQGGGGGAAGGPNGIWSVQAGTSGNGIDLVTGLVINAGTIAGMDAVSFSGLGTVEVDPGAVFQGNVVAAQGSMLELGGAVQATLDMGGSFAGFSTINFATNAAWTLTGTAAELLAGETITGFRQGDALVLLGTSIISAFYVSGSGLVLNGTSSLEIGGLSGGYTLQYHGGNTTLIPNLTLSISPGQTVAGSQGQAGSERAYSLGYRAGGATNRIVVSDVYKLSGSAGAAGVNAQAAGLTLTSAGNVDGGAGGDAGTGHVTAVFGEFAYYIIGLAGAGGVGVLDVAGGSIANSGVIAGGNGGIGRNAASTLGLPPSGFALSLGYYYGGAGAAGGGAVLAQSAIRLTNLGTITGGDGGAGGLPGIYFNPSLDKGGSGGAGGVAISSGSGSSLVNQGVIAGGIGGNAGQGTIFSNTENYSYGGAAGAAGAGGAAVVNSNSSLVRNTGTIIGGDGGTGGNGRPAPDAHSVRGGGAGSAGGSGGYAVDSQTGLTLINTGNITGGTGGTGGMGGAGAFQKVIGYGGFANYYEATAGVGGSGGNGGTAIMAGAAATLFNQGLIIGGSGGEGGAYGAAGGPNGQTGAGGAGIVLAGGIITNVGTIAGGTGSTQGYAISFTGYGTLVVDPGAVFEGAVVASAGGYLELGGSTTGILNMGGFTGFKSIGFSATAAWTLLGTSEELLSGEAISHFGHQDAIDITGVTISRYVVSNDAIVLFDSGVVVGALDLTAADIPDGDRLIAYNDGNGGTEIAIVGATVASGTLDSTPTIAPAAGLTALSGATIASPTINGGTLNLESGATLLGTIAFTGTAGLLILDAPPPSNTITGFNQSDTIELANVPYLATDTATVGTPGTLTITASGETYSLNIAGAYVGESFALSGDLLIEVACFCPGTRIATARGSQKIETLRIGDLIKTTTAGMQPIKWIGTRTYAAPFCNTLKTLPIRIAAGALGPKMPSRDLYISPGHALSLDGHLVQAGRLINATSITQLPHAESVTYYHIELATHALILAENCPAETFLGEEFRAQFHNAPDDHRLYPGTCAPQPPCQPYVRDGFELFSLQRRLAWRAGVVMPLHTTGPLRGCLDEAGPVLLRGWAQDVSAPEHPVSLTIMAGSTYAGQVLANSYREDLYRAGLGSGHHAFEFSLPPSCTVPITLRRSADGSPLPDATRHAA